MSCSCRSGCGCTVLFRGEYSHGPNAVESFIRYDGVRNVTGNFSDAVWILSFSMNITGKAYMSVTSTRFEDPDDLTNAFLNETYSFTAYDSSGKKQIGQLVVHGFYKDAGVADVSNEGVAYFDTASSSGIFKCVARVRIHFYDDVEKSRTVKFLGAS